MGYYIEQADGTRVWYEDDGKSHDAIETIAADITLDAADSGKVFILNAAAGVSITLPGVASAKGFKAKFVVGANFATSNFTVDAATAVIQGGAIVNSTFVASANKTHINFVNSAETVGDYVDIQCDGTNWYVNGVASGAGAITFT